MWLLILRDLQHRRLRVLVVMLLASVVMALLFLMTGLVNQLHREPFDATRAIGASHWVVADGTSGPFTSGAVLPIGHVNELGDSAHGVVVARGTLSQPGNNSADDDGAEVVVVGGDPASLQTTMAAALVEGRPVGAADEIVLDRRAGYDVGDQVRLGPDSFVVVGLTSRSTILAGLPLVFVEIGSAQDLAFQSRDVVSAVLLADPPPSAPAGTVVLSANDVAENALDPLEDAIASVDLVRALLWLVTAIVIGAVVFLSALERQRDFAILRAVGTPRRVLLLAVAAQAAIIALAAAAIAVALHRLLLPVFPLTVRVPMRALWQIPLGAVAAALAAGAFGLRRVASTDPALAFADSRG
jgi:putative ABC transport system permease protein